MSAGSCGESVCRIISMDLGMRNLATTVENGAVKFYGSEIRRVRRKYGVPSSVSHTGTRLEMWSPADRRDVKRCAREAARQIVEAAKRLNAVIAIGNPGTKPRVEGGYWCRGYWPTVCFIQSLKAKAHALGVNILEVPEDGTSRICSCCGTRGIRRTAKFACPHCGAIMDSDANAARNIDRRARELLAKTDKPAAAVSPVAERHSPARVSRMISAVVCETVAEINTPGMSVVVCRNVHQNPNAP